LPRFDPEQERLERQQYRSQFEDSLAQTRRNRGMVFALNDHVGGDFIAVGEKTLEGSHKVGPSTGDERGTLPSNQLSGGTFMKDMSRVIAPADNAGQMFSFPPFGPNGVRYVGEALP
jgi:hypothetical protein